VRARVYHHVFQVRALAPPSGHRACHFTVLCLNIPPSVRCVTRSLGRDMRHACEHYAGCSSAPMAQRGPRPQCWLRSLASGTPEEEDNTKQVNMRLARSGQAVWSSMSQLQRLVADSSHHCWVAWSDRFHRGDGLSRLPLQIKPYVIFSASPFRSLLPLPPQPTLSPTTIVCLALVASSASHPQHTTCSLFWS
jgi:hypothetical protein